MPERRSAERTSASSVFLWLRPDLPRDEAAAYWAGPHSQLVARTPGFREYRQHHLAAHSTGAWPELDGVQTVIPGERRIDGMPEVTFEHPWSPLLGRQHARKVHQDERNVFARTILHVTRPSGGRWFRTGYGEEVGARVVVLLRRRSGVVRGAFGTFVSNVLGPALNGVPGVLELRTQAFLPFRAKMWDTPGVAHDYPADQRFHASIVVGAADSDALTRALAAGSSEVAAQLCDHCAAIHAYDVEATYLFTRDGRPTLPQRRPERKPRLDPAKRHVPPPPARSGQERSAEPFPPARRIPLSGNPEDVVVDTEGRLLGGAEGGRILRVEPGSSREETVADTGGRPLGLELLPDGRLIVCDAHLGLLRADLPTGEVETLVRFVDGIPLRFCSNAAAAADGTIWFTESTSRYDFEHYLGAILEHRPSGRLMRRDPDGSVEVVLDQLDFANGVALTEDQSAVIFAETAAARISRLPTSGPRAGEAEVIADDLPGYPDNLSRVRDGRFWAGLTNPRDPALARLGTAPGFLRKLVWRIPDRLRPEGKRTVWAMAFDETGNVLRDLQEPRGDFHMATGVAEHDGRLYLASPEEHALLALDLTGDA